MQQGNSGSLPSINPAQATRDPKGAILQTIRDVSNNTQNGMCHFSDIVNALKHVFNPQVIKNYLMKFESDGDIYNTDEHSNDPCYAFLGNQ
mmetsp:Transcript_21329/g.18472  ORF Transcript_21329/g.18472 Transcript_21329/m.18472 type:complete len:91 (-) Transcript_21329:1705-1977(-)